MENTSFDKASKIYQKYFSLGYLNTNCQNKLACISLICCVTYELRKKGKNVSCYDVILQIGKNFSDSIKNTFFKALACICEDMMYGCTEFPDFGLKPKEMPKNILKILNEYCPFLC